MIHLCSSAARDLSELVEANADDAERKRRLSRRVVDALRDAGVLRMGVPEEYGGPGCDPATMLDVVETISAADGAAGWCTMIASTTSIYSLFMAPEWAERVFGERRSMAVGAYAPNGSAEEDGDGWRVSGRWLWGSGTHHSDWIGGGVQTAEGVRLMFFPKRDVEIHDTWYSAGLRATSSNDFSVLNAHVPAGRTVLVGAAPVIASPLARFPTFTLLAVNVAAVGLGIARRALDEFAELAVGKRPQFSKRTLAQSASVQADFADAEARLRAGRAYLHAEVAEAWEHACADRAPDLRRRVRIRLAAIAAAQAAGRAVDAVYTLAGGSSVFDSSPLQRCMRDVHVVTQHVMVTPRLRETLGRAMLGADVDASML